MKIEISFEELQRIINCMCIADDEFGPLDDKEFYKLLKKLKKIEKIKENDKSFDAPTSTCEGKPNSNFNTFDVSH